MCWSGGIITLEEYRNEIADIKEIFYGIFKSRKKKAVYKVELKFRDYA